MATLPRPIRRVSSAARQQAQQYLRSVETGADQTVDSAESCVREHPESAVWTAFSVGLLMGAVAGWVAAERHERGWHDEVGDFAARLRSRLRW